MQTPSPVAALVATLGKLCLAAGVFVAIVGGWAWAGPLIARRMPLPDVTWQGGSDHCAVWFVGSSTVHRWSSMPRDVPGWYLHGRGINAALLDQITVRFRVTHSRTPPVAIVAYAGENDIDAGKSGPEAAAAMAGLARDSRRKWPDTPFFIVGLKPSPVRWEQRPEQLRYNIAAAAYARRTPGVTFIPAGSSLIRAGRPDPALFVDGIHMNDAGYRVWSRDIRAGLANAMPGDVRATCSRRTTA